MEKEADKTKKAYTGRGDQGKTTDGRGIIYSKADCLIECVGEIDDLQSAIDQSIYDLNKEPFYLVPLNAVQEKLWQLAGEIINCDEKLLPKKITLEDVKYLEGKTDDCGKKPETFIRFHKTQESIHLNECRTRCRRLERVLVAEKEKGKEIREEVLSYINRLSSMFHMMAYKKIKDSI